MDQDGSHNLDSQLPQNGKVKGYKPKHNSISITLISNIHGQSIILLPTRQKIFVRNHIYNDRFGLLLLYYVLINIIKIDSQ